MSRSRHIARAARLLSLAAALLLTSCLGTLSVGIEQTPTPDPAPAATLVAMQEEIERLSSELATAVAPPTTAPTTIGRVAYIKGGDLWYVVVPTGPHQRLTIDGYNHEPRWSPSGEWLAYRKDRTVLLERETPCRESLRQGEPPCRETVSTFQEQVWTMRRTGEASRVLNLGITVRRFAWSPQSDRLAYVSDQGHLQVLDPVSESEHRLVSAGPGALVGEIAWSADGTRIAYEWLADADEVNGAASSNSIFVIDAAGGQPALLLRSGRTRPSLAGWSGGDVLIWQRDDRAAQPEESAWLYAVSAREQEQGSPQGVRLLAPEAMLPLRDFISIGPANQDYPVAFVTGAGAATWTNKRVATATFRTPPTLAAIAPSWAPDGIWLAYVAMPDAPDIELGIAAESALKERRLWVTAPAAGATRQLTDDEQFRDERPLWSNQGTHLLFARITSEGQASLWLTPADDGEPQVVVDELTPAPDVVGNYGHINWGQHFDWWRG
jgi:dipeptidyl aminopeptidase/acylaminoacyl peptidase